MDPSWHAENKLLKEIPVRVVNSSHCISAPDTPTTESNGPAITDCGIYGHLPIELFRTANSCYVFDARNVCFFNIDTIAFDILTLLRERPLSPVEIIEQLHHYSKNEIRRTLSEIGSLQKEGLLTSYTFTRAPRFTASEVEHTLSTKLAGFTVFITTECNLGCSYCIYGGQYKQHNALSQTPMSWDVLKETMEFLAKHSLESNDIRVDFFGGEPLLAFALIEQGIRYLRTLLAPDGPRLSISITSNGTVMPDRVLDFLIDQNVHIQFSIDGGASSHNMHRPFKHSDRGSFEVIMRNLRRIHARNEGYFRSNVHIKGVLTTETLDDDDKEFFEDPVIREIVDSGHFVFVEHEPNYDIARDADYFARLHHVGQKLLTVRGVKDESELIQSLNVKERSIYFHSFNKFFEAPAATRKHFGDLDTTPFTKGCMTGYKEGAVDPNGDIFVCLKSAKGSNFRIGSVRHDGWFFDQIHKLSRKLHHEWADCSSCFVQKMCELCYEKLDGEDERWFDSRRSFCAFNRARHRVTFQYMIQVAENNPELWGFMDKVIQVSLGLETPDDVVVPRCD